MPPKRTQKNHAKADQDSANSAQTAPNPSSDSANSDLLQEILIQQAKLQESQQIQIKNLQSSLEDSVSSAIANTGFNRI